VGDDKKEALSPYPENSFIGPAAKQISEAFVPAEQMCLVNADVTWDKIIAADKRIISKARSIDAVNFLLSIAETVKVPLLNHHARSLYTASLLVYLFVVLGARELSGYFSV
jgi:hypothetical protein